jgi:hypothetical protein
MAVRTAEQGLGQERQEVPRVIDVQPGDRQVRRTGLVIGHRWDGVERVQQRRLRADGDAGLDRRVAPLPQQIDQGDAAEAEGDGQDRGAVGGIDRALQFLAQDGVDALPMAVIADDIGEHLGADDLDEGVAPRLEVVGDDLHHGVAADAGGEGGDGQGWRT